MTLHDLQEHDCWDVGSTLSEYKERSLKRQRFTYDVIPAL